MRGGRLDNALARNHRHKVRSGEYRFLTISFIVSMNRGN